MKATTWIDGVELMPGVRHEDGRGYLDVCIEERAVECDRVLLVQNERRGTVRGMHYQTSPDHENKLVMCVSGSIFDVVVDMRPESKTYGGMLCVLLEENNPQMLYVPEGVAHGYQCLVPGKVLYLINGVHSPICERGLVWNDPTLNIPWPIENAIVSDRDARWPRFK